MYFRNISNRLTNLIYFVLNYLWDSLCGKNFPGTIT